MVLKLNLGRGKRGSDSDCLAAALVAVVFQPNGAGYCGWLSTNPHLFIKAVINAAEQSGKGPGSRGRPGGCSAHYSSRVNQSHREVETLRVQTRLSWNCSLLGKTTRVPQRHESEAPAAPKTVKMNLWEKLLELRWHHPPSVHVWNSTWGVTGTQIHVNLRPDSHIEEARTPQERWLDQK